MYSIVLENVSKIIKSVSNISSVETDRRTDIQLYLLSSNLLLLLPNHSSKFEDNKLNYYE